MNARVWILGMLICAVAAAATPYVTLKLGQSVDLTIGGMFLAAYLLGGRVQGRELGIQLNIIQTMIATTSGVAFMVVILSAFYYIKTVFNRDIGFNPEPWQMFVWLTLSANLGVFMGVVPRKSIMSDKSLPWPASRATLSVAQTLSDPAASASTALRRQVLGVTTGVAGFLTFLRDGLGVISASVGNAALNISLGWEFAAIGLGMLVPLSVGLSGLLGTWVISVFGDKVARLAALSGVDAANFDRCLSTVSGFADLDAGAKATALSFLGSTCGKGAEFVQASSHFKYVVQWMMWPATAMMIAAALTSVIISVVRNTLEKRKRTSVSQEEVASQADEHIPGWWVAVGIAIPAVLLVWVTSAWFHMPLAEVLLAIAIQPFLIAAGLRVLGITGSGPVSLMANATQFIFGLMWPAQIRSNLTAAYISANPQASSENAVPAFWVAQRLGGRFKTLILAQLVVIPIGAILTPLVFSMLEKTYGIGLNPGQLSAPTGLKIATLAMVMEQGLAYLPRGAMDWSIAAIVVGVVFELLLAVKKTDKDGKSKARFWFVPIPSAFGFALILPASLNIALAIGSVISAAWRKFSPELKGSYEAYAAPIASGLIAGEAMVGSILLPALAVLMDLLMG